MSNCMLFVKKLIPEAIIPKKGSQKSAGFDLYSSENTIVPGNGKALVHTGLAIAIPSNNYGRIAPRSGLALKNFIDVGAGVVDEDYRGEVTYGDRIAQIIIEKISNPEIIEVQDLQETERGIKGFGSTGICEEIKDNSLESTKNSKGTINSAYEKILFDEQFLMNNQEFVMKLVEIMCSKNYFSNSQRTKLAQSLLNGIKI